MLEPSSHEGFGVHQIMVLLMPVNAMSYTRVVRMLVVPNRDTIVFTGPTRKYNTEFK